MELPTINLRIYGNPVAKQRVRVVPVMRHGRPVLKDNGWPLLQAYTEKETVKWEKDIKLQARSASPGFLWDKAIRADIEFVFPRDTKAALKRHYHTVKPDRDNLEKLFLDALHGIIFTGDQRICAGICLKRYTKSGEEPGIIAKFTLLEG